MSKSIGTVCFIIQDNRVLLARIRMPDGKQVWNGLGGVVEEGESFEEAVAREMTEETKLIIKPEDVTEAKMVNIGDLELHVMVTKKWAGELVPNEPSILKLRWFDVDAVPYDQMHPGNDEWLPEVLKSNTR